MVYKVWITFALIYVVNSKILRLQSCDKFDADFSIIYKDKVLLGAIISKYHGLTWIRCVQKCIQYQECKSINYLEKNNSAMDSNCELNSKEILDKGVKLVDSLHLVGRSAYAETPKQQRMVSFNRNSFTSYLSYPSFTFHGKIRTYISGITFC